MKITVIEYGGEPRQIECESFEFRCNHVVNWIRFKFADGSQETIDNLCVIKGETVQNGIPLDKIRAEIKESIDDFRMADWETNNILADGLQMALNIIDSYMEGEQE